MLWVLKRTVSMRLFFWVPKTKLKQMGKKIFTILHSKICLSKSVYSMEASYGDTSYVHPKHKYSAFPL